LPVRFNPLSIPPQQVAGFEDGKSKSYILDSLLFGALLLEADNGGLHVAPKGSFPQQLRV